MATIVVAEDDKFIAHAYRNALELDGHDVHMAVDGDEALKFIAKYEPDLVMLDLVMPGRNGFDTLKTLRQKDKETPVIILSNLGQDSDIKQCEKYGISAYLVKSNTSMKEVLKTMKKYLKKAKTTTKHSKVKASQSKKK